MEILAWLWWALVWVFSLAWSIIWFLISGWVSTLLQVLLLIALIYVLKFGWRRAPFEMLRHGQTTGRMFWNWLRAKEGVSGVGEPKVREVVRFVRAKEIGDINISTLMTLLVITGLMWLAML